MITPIQCFRGLLGMLGRRCSRMLALVAVLIVSGLFPIGTATLVRRAVDSMSTLDGRRFTMSILGLLLCYFGGSLLVGAGVRLRVSIAESLAVEQRKRIVGAVLGMPLADFERVSRGDLLSRLTDGANESSRFFTNLYAVLERLVRALACVVYMIWLSPRLGTIAFLSSAVAPLLSNQATASLSRKSKEHQESLGEVSSLALHSLEGIVVIKAYSASEWIRGLFRQRAHNAYDTAMSVARRTSVAGLLGVVAAFAPLAAVFIFGGTEVSVGNVSPGTLIAFIHLCADHVSGPLSFLGGLMSDLRRSVGAYARILETLSFRQESATSEIGLPVAEAPALEVRGLSFSYGRGLPVLQDVSMKLPGGSFCVLIGRSGCGKSTLMKLMAGLYEPPPGTLFVDGRDVTLEGYVSLRSLVSHVSHEPFLFPGTVRENLELGTVSAGPPAWEDLRRCLAAADALDLVENLPGGMDAVLGERGVNLSGGERQRLCLARTVLRDAPVLLLDEPTSSVDIESQTVIVRALRQVACGRTCLVVTHRFDLAKEADLVFLMDAGRIIDSGKHRDLLERSELYRALYAGEVASGQSGSALKEVPGSA